MAKGVASNEEYATQMDRLSDFMPHSVIGNTTDSDSVILGSSPNGAVTGPGTFSRD